ncbi:MAG TPA: right-handed parallel beta-helix repeat-containing protein [Bryobacteraceae bacterium]|jgi:parallel beta-helix repeat protein
MTAQNLGTPPPLGLSATDIYSVFRLPSLKDGPSDPLSDLATTLQVAIRAQALSLNGQSPIDSWASAQATIAAMGLDVEPQATAVPFNGTTASALNQLIADTSVARIRVMNPTLTVDHPVVIQRSGLTIDFARAQFTPATSDPYMVRIQGAANIIVENGAFAAGNSAVLINAAQRVVVRNLRIQGLTGDGIVVTGSSQILLSRNVITGVAGAPIIIHRGTTGSVVRDNEIRANTGPSNVNAGIVISDREVDLTSNPVALLGPDGYWVVTQPIPTRLNPPHDNLILSNRVSNNLSSGIYSDGGVRNVIAYNLVTGNSKEGLCLDNGSTANVVTGNTLQQNGQRWGESDDVMNLDGIADGGRLSDGTPAAKVPGISIDNAIYNIIFSNQVSQNYGGGIKIVRTGYFNSIGLNTLYNNNLGEGPEYHFFGIELGAAPGNPPSADLDYTPSRGNIVFCNPTRGPHYSGIFFDFGSDLNDVFDNVIMDAEYWALESIAVMDNNSLNNLTNLPSRNISAGLDPSLLPLGIYGNRKTSAVTAPHSSSPGGSR